MKKSKDLDISSGFTSALYTFGGGGKLEGLVSTAHAWSCPQEAHVKRGARKAEWERWREYIIPHSLSQTQISAMLYPRQYCLCNTQTSVCHSQRVVALTSEDRNTKTRITVCLPACCFAPPLGPIPMWCSHVSRKPCIFMSVKYFQHDWVISHRQEWQ